MICRLLMQSHSIAHQHSHSASARDNSSQDFYNHYKSCILCTWLCKS